MTLSEELIARGFVHQHTGENLAEILDGDTRVIYHGIDPTADSAHAGNMVVWMLLRHLAKAGHTIIFLIGGGTGMIGDPKPDAERVLQDEAAVGANVEKIKEQAQRLVGGDNTVMFVNNADWLLAQPLIGFLRDIGKHFTVNELIKKDAIAARMENEQGISYTEFAYPILQAFDYLQLNKTHGCTVQVGGSDQWGNIVAGVDLIRRKTQTEVHAITVPLVTDKGTGKKFGKSEGNAVWLNAEKTSPFAFYQFWLNTSDVSVVDYLKLFTFLNLEEIEGIIIEFQKNPGDRVAQRRLASEVTAMVHGQEVCDALESVSNLLFDGIEKELSKEEEDILFKNAPVFSMDTPLSIVDLLVESGLASSKREARTFIESGAVEFNGEEIRDVGKIAERVEARAFAILKRGKKNLCVVKF